MHPNPYTKAAGAYGTVASSTDQRVLEGTILLKAAQKLEELSKRLQGTEKITRDEIGSTLEYNQKLWQLFVEDMINPDHPLPQEIKNNVASLGLFIFKRTQEILIDTQPEKFKALVDINRNIAAGLMKKTPPAQTADPLQPSPETAMTDSLA
jgi:flagellar protein FlaF